jgi:hypothetical protein
MSRFSSKNFSEDVYLLDIRRDEDRGLVSIVDRMKPYKGRFPNHIIGTHLNGGKSLAAFSIFLLAKTPLGLVLMIPKVRRKIIHKFAEFLNKSISWIYLQPDGMCKSGAEFHRAVHKVSERYSFVKKNQFAFNVLSGSFFCIHEFDDAYRFRLQDIVSEISKASLMESPRRELKRIFDVAISREGYDDLIGKYKMVKTAITFAPSLYIRYIRDILLELDIDKIRLDSDDIDWAKYKCYDFGGFHFAEGRYAKDNDLLLDYNLMYDKTMQQDVAPELQTRIDSFRSEYFKLVEKYQVDITAQIHTDINGIVPRILFVDKKTQAK